MKKNIFFLLFTLIINNGFAQQGTLEITINKLNPIEGNIEILLYNKAKGFPIKPELAIKKVIAKVIASSIKISIPNLPYGEYAFSIIHDKNANGKLDMRFFIPQEGTAASNNAKSSFGPPSYDMAKFTLNTAIKTLSVDMNY